MPYARKAPKVDIRSLNISTSDQPQKPTPQQTSHNIPADLPYHAVSKELRLIALCSVPLILLLILGSYFDTKQGWVVPLAERLMHIGN